MSIRSFRRAHARRQQREARRARRLARRGRMLVGTTLTATALMAASAQAATTYTVNTGADDAPGGTCLPSPGTCTLRDAITSANADSTADTINFVGSLAHQTITLTNGALPVSHAGGLTITGLGAGSLSVSGGGSSQVFLISTASPNTVEIDGLTIKDGHSSGDGGAIENGSATLALNHDIVSGSTTTASGGGVETSGPLTLNGTTVRGNTASGEGGGLYLDDNAQISNSTISGNTASEGGGLANGDYVQVSGSRITGNYATSGDGGGVEANGTSFTMSHTVVSGNTASSNGGGVESDTKYGTKITDSTLSGNTVAAPTGTGGGLEIDETSSPFSTPKYNPVEVTRTTISGNTAARGAGVGELADVAGAPIKIEASTISGNHGIVGSFGGGVFLGSGIKSPFELVDSTISGNTATRGGGIALSYGGTLGLTAGRGSIALTNDTVASNSATGEGGGIYLGQYSTGGHEHSARIGLTSTIVSGNKRDTVPQDLFRPASSTSGGFISAFSLIVNPGATPLLTSKHTLLGLNPQLGPLANHGGPTKTMLPKVTSPVIDQGHADNGLNADQRGKARTIDVPVVSNVPGGDATDIGSVELPAAGVPGAGFTATIRRKSVAGSRPPRPLVVGSTTPVICAVRVGSVSSCSIVVRSSQGTVLAQESSSTNAAVTSLSARPRLTKAGRSALAGHPLGVSATTLTQGTTSRSGAEQVSGTVQLLPGTAVTFPINKNGSALPKKLRGELGTLAGILAGTKQIACTVHPGNDTTHAQAKSQAASACSTVKKAGYKGGLSSQAETGGPHRLVISFSF